MNDVKAYRVLYYHPTSDGSGHAAIFKCATLDVEKDLPAGFPGMVRCRTFRDSTFNSYSPNRS